MKTAHQFRIWLVCLFMLGSVTLACLTTPTSTPTPQPPTASDYNQQGLDHAYAGDLEQALQDFKQAVELDLHNADYRNNVCWFGSLAGHASEVIGACRQAVELAPQAGYIRDSRGLALALTGDYERAIVDFKFFVAWCKESENDRFRALCPKRENWIAELEAGRNPFDEVTLQDLLNE
jgi:tetratricopeptide (TPR) repeat protein